MSVSLVHFALWSQEERETALRVLMEAYTEELTRKRDARAYYHTYLRETIHALTAPLPQKAPPSTSPFDDFSLAGHFPEEHDDDEQEEEQEAEQEEEGESQNFRAYFDPETLEWVYESGPSAGPSNPRSPWRLVQDDYADREGDGFEDTYEEVAQGFIRRAKDTADTAVATPDDPQDDPQDEPQDEPQDGEQDEERQEEKGERESSSLYGPSRRWWCFTCRTKRHRFAGEERVCLVCKTPLVLDVTDNEELEALLASNA
jgi:ribosomal protein L12E/L44/L45/RPP1/RPP2